MLSWIYFSEYLTQGENFIVYVVIDVTRKLNYIFYPSTSKKIYTFHHPKFSLITN